MFEFRYTLTVLASLALLGCGAAENSRQPGDGAGEGSGDGEDGEGTVDEPPERDDGGGGTKPDDGVGHGGGGGDDGTDVDGHGGDGYCGSTDHQFTFEWMPPNVMLVLDESGSMLTPWDHDEDAETDDVTRWYSLHTVVTLVTSAFEDRMNFGLTLFPGEEAQSGDPDLACFVREQPNVPVSPFSADAILSVIAPADSNAIRGGTPATAGITFAHAHLLDQTDELPRSMILVTDGAANCKEGEIGSSVGRVYDDNLEPAVAQAYGAMGTPTYVVGINIVDEVIDSPGNPVINPFQALNAVAEAGGVARHGEERFYNVFSELELETALDEVAARIECTFVLDEEPLYPENVRVEIGGEGVSRLEECGESHGWVFTDGLEGAGAIELCNSACDRLQQVHEVQITYDCPE